jgi:hypothetical protein
MKLQYSNAQKTECTLHISYDACVCLRLWKGQYLISNAMEGFGTEEENKDPVILLGLQCFQFCLLVKRLLGISEGCIKDVKLANTDPNGLLLPAGLWPQRIRKYFKC